MAKIKKTPVIVVLGHVDHGKTSLLDNIRKTNLAKKEEGGITQSIGAWRAQVKGRSITFIDTPGHSAFSQMRSRGAKVADIAILVVAADDSVMPQTKEAIKIIESAGIPFIVAVTKTDLPGADLEKVKADLARENIIVEEYGGQVVMIPVSNKTGQGIEELLEMLVLTYEVQPIKVELNRPADGFILETQFDKRRGKLVSLIVSRGKLKKGDILLCQDIKAKVRALYDDNGRVVSEVEAGRPAQVWGFNQLPQIGDVFQVIDKGDLKLSKKVDSFMLGLDQLVSSELNKIDKTKVIPIFLKAKTKGALEAIASNLPKEVKVVYQAVGDVTESEIGLAVNFGVEIITFQIQPKPSILTLAQNEGVVLKNYNIIYEILEDFEKKVLKLLEPTIDQNILARAKIVKIFNIKDKQIAGCHVIEGDLNLADKVELIRQDKIIGKSKIISLRIGSELKEKVKQGDECGLMVKPKLDFKEGDMLCSYKE